MATTATNTQNQPVTYSLLVIFTVDPSTDEHLHDQQAIRDEADSWLASLDATVHGVNIRKADSCLSGCFRRPLYVAFSRPQA